MTDEDVFGNVPAIESEDKFKAVFQAARGTISAELDLGIETSDIGRAESCDLRDVASLPDNAFNADGKKM